MKSSQKNNRDEIFGRVRRSFPRMHRILVPLDFSGKSRQALAFAVPIAEMFSAKIVLLHVLTAAEAGKKQGQTAAARRAQAEKRMRETAARAMPEDVLAEAVVKSGKPAGAILKLAADQNVDMIAIATDARSGFRRLIKGSTTDEVLRLAPCPVLIIRKK